MRKYCILIPAYNEEKYIAAVVEGIKKYSDAKVLVVDDGSYDHTAKKAEEAGAFVIRHPFNMGYGVALQTGYKHALAAGYDCLLQMDGDGQHDPGYINDFFQHMDSQEYDLIIGSRFLCNNDYRAGFLKFTGISLFRFIIWVVTGEKNTDPTSGYQCLSKKVFTVFTDDSFPSDYPDANVLIMLHRLGFKIKEIPVSMSENPEGRSMHEGVVKVMYYFFKVLLCIFIAILRDRSFYSVEV